MLRELAERATRRTVLRRRLPRPFGGAPIYVSGSAGLRFLLRPMERVDPTLMALARTQVRPGDVVWDVGANVGLFAFCAAQVAGPEGRVFAFEPDTWLVDLLRRSARAQPASAAPVTVVGAAAAGACGLRSFHLAARSRAASSLAGYGSTQSGGAREVHTVPALALDWLVRQVPAPAVVKIDVEGAELEVLEGASRLLQEVRPRLLCEVAGERAAAVTALLRGAGYRLFDADAANGRGREIEVAAWNTVALPDERASGQRRHLA